MQEEAGIIKNKGGKGFLWKESEGQQRKKRKEEKEEESIETRAKKKNKFSL